jgi:hypothetical protein
MTHGRPFAVPLGLLARRRKRLAPNQKTTLASMATNYRVT